MSKLTRKRNPTGQVETEIERARRLYESFHDVEPPRLQKIHMPDYPEAAAVWGEIISIVYRPLKPSLRADSDWEHEFTDRGIGFARDKERPWLLVSPDGQQIFVYKHKSTFKVGGRGIVR